MASGDVIHSIEEYERDLGAIKKKPSTLDRHEGKSWEHFIAHNIRFHTDKMLVNSSYIFIYPIHSLIFASLLLLFQMPEPMQKCLSQRYYLDFAQNSPFL